MGFHYKYNASSAHIWLNCAGAKYLESLVPEGPVHNAAITGTAAHFLGEWALTHGYGNQVTNDLVGVRIRINDDGDATEIVTGPNCGTGKGFSGVKWVSNPTAKPKGFAHIIPVDAKMIKAVSQYTEIASGIIQKYAGQAVPHVEKSFELASDMGGSSDFSVTIKQARKLIVLDYKNGVGIVNAKNNPQMAMYGVGALYAFGPDNFDEAVLGIVQPNTAGSPLETWKVSISEILDWQRKFFEARNRCEAAEKVLKVNPTDESCFTMGPWCKKWCKGSVKCPLMHKQALAIAQRDLGDLGPAKLPAVHKLDDTRLLWLYNNGPAITEFLSEVKSYMGVMAISHGKKWPGLKVVESVTKTKMIDADVLASKLKGKYNMAFESKVKALSKLKKIVPANILEPHVFKPPGAPVLALESDGRELYHKNVLDSIPTLD